MITHLAQAVAPVAAAVSSGPSWTEVAAALGAGAGGLGGLGGLVVALVLARYARGQFDAARGQLDEARTLRREQTRPSVVVYADVSPLRAHLVDLIITNLGPTGAHEVMITCTPPLVRTDGSSGHEAVELPEQMPFLAPGQRWRTLWDSAIDREGAGLHDRFEVTATYTDAAGEQHRTTSVLDWRMFRSRVFMDEKGLHDLARSVASIDKTLSRRSGKNEVQRVAVYDGPRRDKQQAADLRRRARRHEDLVARVLPDPAQGPTARMDGTVS